MTNPNNAVGTNGAFGGRTSVNAFNDNLGGYTTGVLSGWECSPSSGLTVVLGGDGNTRDVAIAEDNAGNKTTINNISGSPISVTVGNAPNNNSRIDAIVAYVDNPPTGSSTATDNYGACGLIVVAGTVASTPVVPTESAIRTAITGDGASGTTAYYVVLAYVTVASGTTDIDAGMISVGQEAIVANSKVGTNSLANKAVTAGKIDFSTLSGNYSTTEVDTGYTWIDGSKIYKKTITIGSLPDTDTKRVAHGISSMDKLIDLRGGAKFPNYQLPIPCVSDPIRDDIGTKAVVRVYVDSTDVIVDTGMDRTGGYAYVTLYYTKTS